MRSVPVLALDLGGTKLSWAKVDRRGRLSGVTAQPTVLSSASRLLAQLKRVVRDSNGNVAAVGISIPGLARPDGSVWAPNLPGWTRMPLRRELESVAGVRVVVESDRNCSVLGEAWRGAARGEQDVICVMVGTGIGAGILSGGRLVRGADELSGCAGWLAVTDRLLPEYRNCGVLESLAAGPAIARRAGLESVEQVVRAARHGEQHALQVLRQAGESLGLAVANMICLFNPRVVVLGGGVSAAGDFLLRPLRCSALRWTQPLAARRVRIIRSRLGGQSPLLGAAWSALQ